MKIERKVVGLWLVGLLSLLLCNGHAYAESYGDYFLYDIKKLPPKILVDTIGIVVLSSEVKENTERPPQPSPIISQFLCYERSGDQFFPAREVPVVQTLPVGIGGYGGWVKYLVTSRLGEFVQVIIDPYKDQRIWHKLDKNSNLVIYSELVNRKHPIGDEIDIFLLYPEINLYSKPKQGMPSKVLHKADLQHKVSYYPIAYTDKYIQIGRRYMKRDRNEVIDGEPIGWIRMRDKQGRVAFHIFTYTWN